MSPSHRRRLVLAVLALGTPALVAVPASSASAVSGTSCAVRVAAVAKRTDAGGTFTRVARTGTVEVFSPEGPGFGAYHYACVTRTGALHRFARNSTGLASTDLLTASVQARGDDVAYRVAARGDTSTDRFVVISGRTGRTLRDSGAVRTTERGAPRSDQLVLLPDATIAWAARGAGVHVTDAAGDHVLAPASAAVATRLTATSKAVSWTAGGKRRHAPLP